MTIQTKCCEEKQLTLTTTTKTEITKKIRRSELLIVENLYNWTELMPYAWLYLFYIIFFFHQIDLSDTIITIREGCVTCLIWLSNWKKSVINFWSIRIELNLAFHFHSFLLKKKEYFITLFQCCYFSIWTNAQWWFIYDDEWFDFDYGSTRIIINISSKIYDKIMDSVVKNEKLIKNRIQNLKNWILILKLN